jgi:hypothetical protein
MLLRYLCCLGHQFMKLPRSNKMKELLQLSFWSRVGVNSDFSALRFDWSVFVMRRGLKVMKLPRSWVKLEFCFSWLSISISQKGCLRFRIRNSCFYSHLVTHYRRDVKSLESMLNELSITVVISRRGRSQRKVSKDSISDFRVLLCSSATWLHFHQNSCNKGLHSLV